MKNSNYFKIASTLLVLSVFAGCASLPVQQGEYDDVYFTSADRAQPKTVVIDPEGKGDLGENVVTLEKSSDEKVEADLISKYNNGSPQEVVYFEEIDPRVSRAAELNYDDFVWDYNNELLKNYDLPLEWDDMDPDIFNNIVSKDFSFRNAWYEQYYRGNTSLMDAYVSNSNPTRNNRRFSSSNININMGFGFGFGGFGSPFRSSIIWGDPFYSPYAGFYDPFWSFGYSRRSIWLSSYNSPYAWGYDPYFNSYYSWNSTPWRWRRNNWYWGGNTVIIAENNYNGRNYTRGGRIPSTSVTSVRSDAVNGSGRTRSSAALNNSSRTRSTISSGRVSNTSVRSSSVAGTRSSRSTSSVDEALRRSSNRVRTDAYRISSGSRSSSSSRSSVLNRTSTSRYRSSSIRASIPTYSRSSSSNSRSSISFNRNTSSRSSSSVFSRSSRSSSSRSSGFSRSSSSSSRSSGSVSRSSGSSSRSSSSSGSSRSSSSSSGSRGGRGN